MRHFLISFVTVFLLGCIPQSDNPITNRGKEQLDSSILGTWFGKDDNESSFLHIGLDKESKLLRLIMLDYKRDGRLEYSELSGHTSTLKGNKYLNLKLLHPKQDDLTGYIFMKYVVTSDSLGISFMNSSVVEKAINDGSLEGKVKNGWFSLILTDTQKKLQEFITREDKKLFTELQYLPKLKLPNQSSKQTGKPAY